MPHKTLHTLLREMFEGYAGKDYYWMAKDGKGLSQIIKQLEWKVKIKKGECTETDLLNSFHFILNAIENNIELRWYKQNFSISIINSKLNEIISTLKNGKSNRKEVIATQLRNHFEEIARADKD